MSAPIYQKLLQMYRENNYPLHMPGHKRNKAFFAPEVFNLDFTEVGENDNLHHPDGIIMEAEREFARLMGCDLCKMLVNGGSSGVIAALTASVGENKYVLAASNCHKSVINGMVISGSIPVYIQPQISPIGIVGGILPSTVQEAFDLYPQIRAAIITSPSYEGFTSNIAAIADIVHKHNALLIVDETHGAHFPFHKDFPCPAIRQGADITIESWHKTLPALNQSALLCVNSKRVDIQRVLSCFSLVTTTSPSYIMLSQMDYARDMLCKNSNFFDQYVNTLLEARERLSSLGCTQLVSLKGNYGVYDEDISKLVLAYHSSMGGTQAADIFKSRYGFQVELAAPHHIIAMTSVADDSQRLMEFAQAAAEIDSSLVPKKIMGNYSCTNGVTKPEITPRQTFYADTVVCPLSDAEGKISAAALTPYPPDVPIILPGEKITRQKIMLTEEYINAGIDVIGVEAGKISCIKK